MSNLDYNMDHDIASAIFKELRNIYEHESFSDFTVVVDGAEFRCHKFIFAACSAFFNGLLRSGMRESQEQSVTLQGLTKSTFSLLQKCLYSGCNIFLPETVIDLWHAINQLQINCLMKKCEEFLLTLAPKHYGEYYIHAKLLDSSKIADVCLHHMEKDFEAFSKSDYITDVQPEDFLRMLSHNQLLVSSEDLVVYAILKWVAYTPCQEINDSMETEDTENITENNSLCRLESQKSNIVPESSLGQISYLASKSERKKWLCTLLKATRLCLVSTTCIEVLMSNQDVLQSQEALRMVREVVIYQLKPSHCLSHWPFSAIYRMCSKLENMVIFLDADSANLKAYSFERRQVHQVSQPPCTMSNSSWFGENESQTPHSLCVFENQVFLIKSNKIKRGFFPLSDQQTVVLEVLCSLTSPNNWAPVVHLKENIQTVLAYEKQMYLIGSAIYKCTPGKDYSFSNAHKVCDLYSVSWTPILSHRFQNKIMIMGSSEKESEVKVVIFDPETLETNVVEGFDGPVDGMVAFNTEKEEFLLQKNGSLWRIEEESGIHTPHFKLVTKLWQFDWDLKGAVVHDGNLHLFGCQESQRDLNHWSSSLPGVFGNIVVVHISSITRCLPVILPRLWIKNDDSFLN